MYDLQKEWKGTDLIQSSVLGFVHNFMGSFKFVEQPLTLANTYASLIFTRIQNHFALHLQVKQISLIQAD